MVSSSTGMRVRPFGRTDLQVSELGLGCARIGGVFKNNSGDFVKLLMAALDGGINFFDTADMYSQGESEKLIGRAFRGRRDRIIIASKAGYVLPSRRKLVARIKPLVRPVIRLLGISRHHLPTAVRGAVVQDFSPAYLKSAVEGSLRRLGTDYMDVLQLHSPPCEVVETGQWVGALEALKREGKIRYYGISCDTVEAAYAALNHPGVSSLQVPINLLSQEFLPVLSKAQQAGVGVIARESLANGLLVKELSPEQIRTYCQSDDEAARKATQIEQFRQAAAHEGGPLPQLALRWVRRLDGVSVSLIGVSSLEQLETLLVHGLSGNSGS
jgi:aryl-alcohol dehydrogenase-like predicted oxidoreductase